MNLTLVLSMSCNCPVTCDAEAGLRQQYMYCNWHSSVDLQFDIVLWDVGSLVTAVMLGQSSQLS